MWELDQVASKSREIIQKYLVLRNQYQDALNELAELKSAFLGHYRWLAENVHRNFHRDKPTDWRLCDDPVCLSILGTEKELNIVAKGLGEDVFQNQEDIDGTDVSRDRGGDAGRGASESP